VELEWAEAEIRLLPGVYACSAAPDGVVVFVDPVHDAVVTTDAVMALLGIFGISLPVRMLGGAVAVAAFGTREAAGAGRFEGIAGVALIAAVTLALLAPSGVAALGGGGAESSPA